MFGIPVDSSMLSSPDDDNEDIELWRGVVLLMDLGVGFVVSWFVVMVWMCVFTYIYSMEGRTYFCGILLGGTIGMFIGMGNFDDNDRWNAEIYSASIYHIAALDICLCDCKCRVNVRSIVDATG